MKIFATIILTIISLHVFGQTGYYASQSDFKSQKKLVEMDSFVDYNNNKAIFMKDGEKVKIKKNNFFAIQDDKGYHYRVYEANDILVKLHVKNSICLWGEGIDSELNYGDNDIYNISSYNVFASKNMTSGIFMLKYTNAKKVKELIKSDNKLSEVVSRIKKLYPKLMFYIIDTYNKRKPLKGKFEK